MRFSNSIVTIIALQNVAVVGASPVCGKWYSTECVGASDARYNPEVSNDLLIQDKNWEHWEGYWILNITSFDNNGAPAQPSPFNLETGTGNPYHNHKRINFFHNKISGSRAVAIHMTVKGPVTEDEYDGFCNRELEHPYRNQTGDAVCGVHGMVIPAGFYGTSTYEKDGTMNVFQYFGGHTGHYPNVPFWSTTTSKYMNIDDSTVYGSTTYYPWYSQNNAYVYTNKDKTEATFSNTGFVLGKPELIGDFSLGTMIKVTEEEWIKAYDEALEVANVPLNNRIKFPLADGECLIPPCPTEALWCEEGNDPSCSQSPHQEPPAGVKPGCIAVICVAVMACFLAGAYFLHRRMMTAQAKRIRTVFAKRIAETIRVRGSSHDMTPEALAEEFKKIATEHGNMITKDELWEFLSDGKAGNVTRSDFDALFAAIDLDGNGTVDFLEFCSFMAKCEDEIGEINRNGSEESRSMMAAKIATGVSKRALSEDTFSDEHSE